MKESTAETQRKIILDALMSGKNISSWWAISNHRITRLAKYINDFRNEGINVLDKWMPNPNGNKFKIYWIEDNLKND